MPTVRPKHKDEQRVKRDDETPSPYSFTKSDIEQLDLDENEESIAAFKVKTENVATAATQPTHHGTESTRKATRTILFWFFPGSGGVDGKGVDQLRQRCCHGKARR